MKEVGSGKGGKGGKGSERERESERASERQRERQREREREMMFDERLIVGGWGLGNLLSRRFVLRRIYYNS